MTRKYITCLQFCVWMLTGIFIYEGFSRIFFQPLRPEKYHAAKQRHAGQEGTSRDSHNVDDFLLDLYLRKLQDLDGLKQIPGPGFCPSNLTSHRGPCVEKSCDVTVPSPEVRLQRSLRYGRSIPAEHAAWIDSLAGYPNFTDLIFITGATANHFRESQGTIRDLEEKLFPVLRQHFRFLSYRLVYYDLGLTKTQLDTLEKHCNCTVIKFPFHKMPEHVQHPRKYSWKPVVIKAHLRFSSVTIWMDASTRMTPDTNKLIKLWSVLRRGPGICVTETYWSMGMHTHPSTLTSLEAPPHCQLLPLRELASGFVVVRNEGLVERAVLNSWVACGLDRLCLCPSPQGQDCRAWYSCNHKGHPYFRCHRFDQSALGVILHGLFPQHVARLSRACSSVRLVSFKRGDVMDYFTGPRHNQSGSAPVSAQKNEKSKPKAKGANRPKQ